MRGGSSTCLQRHPNVEVYFSRPAKAFVDNLVNGEYKFHIVSDNEELPLGGKTLRFINAPFLHWPDTIFTYVVEDKILFPCDFLGSHYSSPTYLQRRARCARKGPRRLRVLLQHDHAPVQGACPQGVRAAEGASRFR